MPNSICNINNLLRVKYLTRLIIRFNHQKEHKFRHNCHNSIDPMYIAAAVVILKQWSIFILHCTNFNTQRQTLFDKIATIDANILTENENSINTLLFGKPNSESSFNKAMLEVSIKFILSTENFNNPLF